MQTDERVTDLVAWLTAIWDEQERLAKAAPQQPWFSTLETGDDAENLGSVWIDTDGTWKNADTIADWCKPGVGEHIAAHDPASVLARIAADRKILAAWRYESGIDYAMGDGGADSGLLFALKCKAASYSDRPGWRSEWDPRDCRHCKPYKERHAYNVYCREAS